MEPLVLGRVASYYYLRVRRRAPCLFVSASRRGRLDSLPPECFPQYTTVATFAASLRADTGLRGLLRILSSAAEYDELPVRHNEDKVRPRPTAAGGSPAAEVHFSALYSGAGPTGHSVCLRGTLRCRLAAEAEASVCPWPPLGPCR